MIKTIKFFCLLMILAVILSCTTTDQHADRRATTVELNPTIASQFISTFDANTARTPDFVEEFTDDRNAWNFSTPETTTINIINESAVVSMERKSGEIEFAPARGQDIAGDGGFAIEFTVKADFPGEGGGWSVVLYDKSGLNDHIGFGIWKDNGLRIWKNIDGEHDQLAENISVSDAYLADDLNVFRVLSSGEETAVLVNEKPICLLQDDISSLGGWFGLRVESANEDATVTFDNLFIWRF